MKRRESLKLIAIASLAAAFPGCTEDKIEHAAQKAGQASSDGGLSERNPTQLSAHEFATITMLVDIIIPADNRSGSASEANVPLFIDFMMEDAPELQTPVHDGLAWMDAASNGSFEKNFVQLTEGEWKALLDKIAYPDSAKVSDKDGVSFFTTLRDLTASGFWSSKMGMQDLNYTGNTPQGSWEGCSHEAMEHLGLSYDA